MRTKPDPTSPSARELVDRVLRAAAEQDAGDVHVDPTGDALLIRFRCDGVLRVFGTESAELTSRVVGRLKSLAGLLVYRTDLPQEGRIPADRSPIGREVRVATYPTVDGERVALRLDTRAGRDLRVEDLGLAPDTQRALLAAIARPNGTVLLAGPGGSGKTTTLYACLRELVDAPHQRSIMSVEDPVERRILGVVQTETSEAAGLDFARALRSLLRQDPEVLLVGEIRDAETAKIALQAGLTGHLVASTVHATSAPQVFARLLEMGVEPYVLTHGISGVLAQRLLRRVCAHPAPTADCPRCHGTGYAGRVLVAEWLPVTEQIRRAVLSGGDGDALTVAARESGCRGLRHRAEQLVTEGVTTRAEVTRVLGE